MQTSLSLTIEDEIFVFDYRRVIYWPKKRIIIGADLHWGKTTFMQQHGIAISDKIFESDLERLGSVIKDYDPQIFLVLGDLIHHEKSMSREVVERIANFRNEHPCEMILLKGNHERYTEFPFRWGIVTEDTMRLEQFYFTHEHAKGEKLFQFSGHLHPTMTLKAGHDVMRLPTFILGKKFCYLPAFSHLTGGQDIRLNKNQKAVLVFPDSVELLDKK